MVFADCQNAGNQVLQCLLHMPQFCTKFRTFAILSAVRTAYSNWGMCSKHCNIVFHLQWKMTHDLQSL